MNNDRSRSGQRGAKRTETNLSSLSTRNKDRPSIKTTKIKRMETDSEKLLRTGPEGMPKIKRIKTAPHYLDTKKEGDPNYGDKIGVAKLNKLEPLPKKDEPDSNNQKAVNSELEKTKPKAKGQTPNKEDNPDTKDESDSNITETKKPAHVKKGYLDLRSFADYKRIKLPKRILSKILGIKRSAKKIPTNPTNSRKRILIVGIILLIAITIAVLALIEINNRSTMTESSDDLGIVQPETDDQTQPGADVQPPSSDCDGFAIPLRCVNPTPIDQLTVIVDHSTEENCWIYLSDPNNPEDLIVYDISNTEENDFQYSSQNSNIYDLCGNDATGRFKQDGALWPARQHIVGVLEIE